MLASAIPTKMPTIWALSAPVGDLTNPVPVPSQIGITNGRASWTDGFPPLNFTPVNAGGVPPFGADFNGVIQMITQWLQWGQAGAPIAYDGTFAAGIGGYPRGAILQATGGANGWLNQADANSANPDAGGANWASIAYSGPLPGSTIKVRASLTAAGGTMTYFADGIVCAGSLGSAPINLATYAQGLNTAGTGQGGMDIGTPAINSFVSIYAGAVAGGTVGSTIFACNGTVSSGTVYSGANKPAGVIATALLGMWPTNGSGQLVAGFQVGRDVMVPTSTSVLSGGTAVTPTLVSLTSAVPPNAIAAFIALSFTEGSVINAGSFGACGPTSAGVQTMVVNGAVVGAQGQSQTWMDLQNAAQIFYEAGHATANVSIGILGYRIPG